MMPRRPANVPENSDAHARRRPIGRRGAGDDDGASPPPELPMKRPVTLFLAMCMSSGAHAQTVQKCVARDGQARYQSEPCGRGLRTAEVWDATPDPVAAPASAAPRAKPRRTRPAGRIYRSQARQVASTADACEQARAFRDEAERRAGLARNYDLLTILQRRVYDACR
jgi:hypothetical protein